MRMTRAQNRRLHAIAAERGFSHAELRTISGARSLALLSESDAASLIQRLEADRPDTPNRTRPRAVAAELATPPAMATPGQWNYVGVLAGRLGWSADRLAGLLLSHGVRSVADPKATRVAMSRCIRALIDAARDAMAPAAVCANVDGSGTAAAGGGPRGARSPGVSPRKGRIL